MPILSLFQGSTGVEPLGLGPGDLGFNQPPVISMQSRGRAVGVGTVSGTLRCYFIRGITIIPTWQMRKPKLRGRVTYPESHQVRAPSTSPPLWRCLLLLCPSPSGRVFSAGLGLGREALGCSFLWSWRAG